MTVWRACIHVHTCVQVRQAEALMQKLLEGPAMDSVVARKIADSKVCVSLGLQMASQLAPRILPLPGHHPFSNPALFVCLCPRGTHLGFLPLSAISPLMYPHPHTPSSHALCSPHYAHIWPCSLSLTRILAYCSQTPLSLLSHAPQVHHSHTLHFRRNPYTRAYSAWPHTTAFLLPALCCLHPSPHLPCLPPASRFSSKSFQTMCSATKSQASGRHPSCCLALTRAPSPRPPPPLARPLLGLSDQDRGVRGA